MGEVDFRAWEGWVHSRARTLVLGMQVRCRHGGSADDNPACCLTPHARLRPPAVPVRRHGALPIKLARRFPHTWTRAGYF